MSLRKKIIIAVSVTIILLLSLLYIGLRSFYLQSFIEIEETLAKRNVNRVIAAYEENIKRLSAMSKDYAFWDETYEHMNDHNESYLQSNYRKVSSFDMNNVNIVLLIDKEGHLAYSNRYKLPDYTNLEVQLYKSLEQDLIQSIITYRKGITGLIRVDNKILMISAQPILDTYYENPANGVLVMAEYLDENYIHWLNEVTINYVSLSPFDINKDLDIKDEIDVQQIDGNVITGYAVLSDIYSQPNLLLEVQSYRDIYKKALVNIEVLFSLLISASILLIVILIVLLEKNVLSRIINLSKRLKDIRTSMNFRERVIVTGMDEVSSLSKEINTLIETIEHDLSVRDETEKSLLIAKDKAEKADQMKMQFLSIMNHEIRTPLNGILGTGEMLQGTELNEEQINYVQLLNQSGNDLLKIINDILYATKLQTGDIEFLLESYDLYQLCNEVLEGSQYSASVKGIELNMIIEKDLPQYVIGDSERIKHILYHLLSNAIKFTIQGEVKFEVKWNKDSLHPRIIFNIHDTGIGISDEQINTIFNLFTQVDSSSTRKHGGLGIGLSIVSQLIKLMGGEINVTSRVGIGSIFTISLPLIVTSNGDGTDSNTKTSKVSTKKVLLAEDSIDNQLLIKAYLKNTPWELDVAENGMEAFEKVIEKQYDVILMDLEMPVMDGLTATKKIREWERKNQKEETPIFAYTAYCLPEDKKKSTEAGCNGHLIKPLKKIDLLNTLEKI